jgi:hypothetical protein
VIVLNGMMALITEVVMLLALARFAFLAGHSRGESWGLTLLTVVLVVTLWGYFAAPKSAHRLGGFRLLVFKIAMFAAGATALAALYGPGWAAGFAALAGLQLGLAYSLDAV